MSLPLGQSSTYVHIFFSDPLRAAAILREAAQPAPSLRSEAMVVDDVNQANTQFVDELSPAFVNHISAIRNQHVAGSRVAGLSGWEPGP